MSGARRAPRGLGGFEGFETTTATESAAPAERALPPPQATPAPPHGQGVRSAASQADTPPAAATAAPAVPTPTPAAASGPRRRRGRRPSVAQRYDCETMRTSIVLPVVVDDALESIVFEQRHTTGVSKNDLVLEGLDAVLKRYGLGPISKLVAKPRAS